ncbi:portal protein [Parasutterella sp.]|uniref:portal protein n=1 Tax=Parasutterella sp. TaxID=2049037 RepID=UPI003AEF98F6
MPADIKLINQRFESLKQERSSWEDLWRDIRDYCLPDLGCFSGEDATQGSKRYRKILDAEAIDCADVLAAGLLGGVSSPSRPWLRLTTMDPDLDKNPAVKEWMTKVQDLLLLYFSKAECYNALHQSYLELPVFGTACTIVKPHPEQLISLQNLTIGEYWLAEDDYGKVDTMYRRLSLTAKQMVQQWGFEAVNNDVRQAFEKDPFTRFNVIHAIEPRIERNPDKRDNKNMPWQSVYFQEGVQDKVLSESGFRNFPALCPRWMTSGGSVYGRGPGAKALSAQKSLQRLHLRLAELVDYGTRPPILYPSTLKDQLSQFKPGGRVAVNPQEAPIIRSMWEVRTDPQAMLALIQSTRQDIQRIFFVNVFQMIAATANQTDRTATEVQALEQEKVMMLGPVLERLHTELLDPLVTNAFGFMVVYNMLPEVPEELYGRELSIEYVSVLAEAQKNASANGIVRTAQQIGLLAQINPQAVDKLDVDATIDQLADMNGVPPSLIVTGQKVALIRQQRAEQQQAQMQAAQLQQAMTSLKDLGQAADSQGLQEAFSEEGAQ